MQEGSKLLDALEEHARRAGKVAEESAHAFAELVHRTREHWLHWDARRTQSQELLGRHREDLSALDQQATAIVHAAEEKLADTEAALRAWIAVADGLRNRSKG